MNHLSQESTLLLPPSSHTNLRLRKVHLGMLRLELLQNILLLLLLARRQSHLLLPLVKHHLLHHPSCLSIQIAQLAVFGLDFSDIDLGVVGEDVRPPFVFSGLFEVDCDKFTVFKGPCGVV